MNPHAARSPQLPDAIAAPHSVFTSRDGWQLAYYAELAQLGRPLVLIHSINAASSSFEMRPLFEHYRLSRPVYSLDLPGFGHSERRATGYTPALYAQAIADFLTQIVGAAADVIALSLSAEFAAQAALSVPEYLASLTLISPTGFGAEPLPSSSPVAALLDWPKIGRWLYSLVASRRSIRHFLTRSFVGPVPEALIDYAWQTAHQPGAQYAPLHFLAMRLFTPDAIDLLYDRLTAHPVLVIADQDPYIRFERLPSFIARHDTWHRETLAPHRGLPHWEKLAATVGALEAFWAQPPLKRGN
ncbi:Pimeloyl-ACP methyl ester carboxylesterase [Allochromatium warmingii]|uniref:Pimeloyl-ACP methyl ester carboxylesterase n=1 Tax=Allochromatium warmingii TaxID=61595 RepID=A0A1H3ESV3_ALLWA|nr:alpha/beta fold hydrolase [Allochromatium warmingii]SDX80999.1 Pimeloyl-ACP methyl ester carboxylesterase [Allochromatium warmingii]